jgi:hypothetical protein
MKILFLDIDGVLKPARSYWLKPHKPDGNFDPLGVAAVNSICRETGAHVVFNTQWNTAGYARMTAIARAEGMTMPVMDITNFPGRTKDRDIGIRDWLAKTPLYIERWCAMDDEAVAVENLVRVDYNNGISSQNYSDAVRLLGGPI